MYVTEGLLNLYLHLREIVSKRNKYENICKFRKKIGQGSGGARRLKDFKKRKKKFIKKIVLNYFFNKELGSKII